MERNRSLNSNKNRRKKINPYGKTNNTMRKKLAGLFLIVVLALICLLIRITYINAVSGDTYTKQVLAQSQSSYSSTVLPFKRGNIVDINGTVLATSEKTYNVILDCKVVNSSDSYVSPTVQALVDVFELDAADMHAKIANERTKYSQYQIVKKNISIEERQAFYDYIQGTEDEPLDDDTAAVRKNVKGIWFEEEYVRKYPMNSLACDLIGFTYDGTKADWGIEGYYNNTLNGVNGRKFGYWEEGSGKDLQQTIIDPIDGDTVVTTIDTNIQKIVEDEMARFDELYKNGPYNIGKGAENVGVIVMNPNNGTLLAMASSDAYDLNDPRNLDAFFSAEEISAMNDSQKAEELEKLWRNYCISDVYEPGSTFKPMTIGAALESGILNGNETFFCDGSEIVSGTRIKCAEETGHGELSLQDVRKPF